MSTLFLKYRPQTFDSLVGQTSVRRTLQNALKAERPSHAYLFAGVRGTGKTSTARIFAKGLNCTDLKNGNPCGKCHFCESTADGSLIDVIEIDAASNRGIDEIRDLREKINFSPSHARRKVYIIDEVHMLTKEAFNALLKTLEEPPDHAFFCLATTEMHKIPQTIVSRCQVFTFSRFPISQLTERLQYICEQEGFSFEDEALEIIARKAEGGMRDAISLLEQAASETENQITKIKVEESLGVSSREILEQLSTALQSGNAENGLEMIRTLSKQGIDFRSFGHDFLAFLREQMLQGVAQGDNIDFILRSIEGFEKALGRLKTSPIMELPLEIAIIELCKKSHPTPVQSAPPQIQQSTTPSGMKSTERHHQKVTKEASTEIKIPTKTSQIEKPEAQETQPESHSNAPFSGDPKAIEARMKEIADKAELPAFVKKSFLTTVPSLEDGRLIFMTDSEFHREKLDTPVHRSNIQKVIIEIFGGPLSIAFIKKDLQRSSTPSNVESSEKEVSAEDFLVF